MLDITKIDEEQVKEAFKVDDDKKAEWAIKKIKAAQAEHDRLVTLAKVEIQELQTQIECFDADLENDTKWLKSQLAEYMQTVECSETKTQSKYKLLSGDLILKKPALKLEKVSDDELIKYLSNNGQMDYLQTTVKPMWGEYKKTLSVVDGKVVTEDGEIIPESVVKAEESAPEFSIKIK